MSNYDLLNLRIELTGISRGEDYDEQGYARQILHDLRISDTFVNLSLLYLSTCCEILNRGDAI
jgi:hypothetical protein